VDRRRAGNFDQAISDFNANSNDIGGNKLKSSLRNSVILVDHPAENDSEMGDEGSQEQSQDQQQIISKSEPAVEDF
jgi:hypothetical protein